MTTCDCSDEYGPCEEHGDVLVIREGASLHTADELALLLISDLVGLGAELSPYGESIRMEAEGIEDRWLPPDLADEVFSVADQLENSAPDLWVIRDDGYTIVRPRDDCPLTAA